MTPDVRCYITQQSTHRDLRIKRASSTKSKKKRVDKRKLKLMQHAVLAKREKILREGLYQTGLGLEDGYTEA